MTGLTIPINDLFDDEVDERREDEVPEVTDDSLDWAVSVEAARMFSPLSLMSVLGERLAKVSLPEDISTMPLNKFVEFFAATMVGLNPKDASEVPMGVPSPVEMGSIRRLPTAVIVEALRRPAPSTGHGLTDSSVVEDVCDRVGTTAEKGLDYADLEAPGLPVIRVSLAGDNYGRCISGGEEYCAALNDLGGKMPYRYQEIPYAVRLWVYYLYISCGLELNPDGSVSIKERVLPSAVELMVLEVAKSSNATNAKTNIIEYLRALLKDKKNYPPNISHKKTRHFMEWVLAANWSGVKKADADAHVDIKKSFLAYWKVVQAFCSSKFVGRAGLTDLMMRKLKVAPKGATAFGPSSVLEFVKQSRAKIRLETIDIKRKYDAEGMSFIDPSASVYDKVMRAIRVLERVGIPESVDGVHAFGTHEGNYWHHAVMNLRPDLPHMYADITDKYRPKIPSAASFVVADITKLDPNSGRNKVLLDDTYPMAQVAAGKGGQNSKMQEAFGERVASVVSAKYACGFMKMYYGLEDKPKGDERPHNVVPTSLSKLEEAYWDVHYVSGSSPHSPEYFVVFSGLKESLGGEDAEVTPFKLEGVQIKERVKVTGAERRVAFAKYTITWLGTKALEMLYANHYKNAMVLMGYEDTARLYRASMYWEPINRYELGGHGGVGSAASRGVVVNGRAPTLDEVNDLLME